jgi:hypothetical protein
MFGMLILERWNVRTVTQSWHIAGTVTHTSVRQGTHGAVTVQTGAVPSTIHPRVAAAAPHETPSNTAEAVLPLVGRGVAFGN